MFDDATASKLKSFVGRVQTNVSKGEKETSETRFYLLSYADVDLFAKSARGHWGVGYHIVALLQSALSGKWLSKLEDPGILTFLLGTLSFLGP